MYSVAIIENQNFMTRKVRQNYNTVLTVVMLACGLWKSLSECAAPWNSLGQNTRVDSLYLLQEIFPTQGLNPGLPHCRQILYQLSHKGSPRILERVAYPFSSDLLTQESNQGLLHCRQILYQLSHKGSPRILEWLAYPFSSRSSRPRTSNWVSCIAGGFFTNWVIREDIMLNSY